MTRFRVMALVAVVQVLLVAGVAFAQAPGMGRRGGPGGPGGPGGAGFGGPAMALRGLNLSETQRQQIRDVMMRHRDQIRTEVFALLTPEQLEKAKQMETRQEERMKQRLERFQQRRQQ